MGAKKIPGFSRFMRWWYQDFKPEEEDGGAIEGD